MTKARDLANIISGGFTVDDLPTLTETQIPNLSASKITSGSIADARLPATALNSNVDLTNLSASNLTSGTIPTARISALPSGVGGKVLQVVNTLKDDIFTTTSTSYVDITNYSATITPSSTSSKILVSVNLQYGGTDHNFSGLLLRGTTEIAKASAGALRVTLSMSGMTNTATYLQYGNSISYLDSPATTSATTYKMQVKIQSGGTFYLNQSARDSGVDPRGVSSITLMEVSE